MLERERLLSNQINDLISKNLYLESYSRRENIKFFNIREEREEDSEEILRKFLEKELGCRNAHTVEIQQYTVLAEEIIIQMRDLSLPGSFVSKM